MGRWVKVRGLFKRRAHNASLVLVHVGVAQRCLAPPADVESSAAALQAKVEHVTFQRGAAGVG